MKEQDEVLGRLTRERNEYKREIAAIDSEIQRYIEPISQLSGELTHSKTGALQTLSRVDLAKLKDLLSEYVRVSSQLSSHSSRIAEMGG